MIPFQKGEEREASVLSLERKILTLHGVNNQKRTNRCLRLEPGHNVSAG